MAVKRSPLFYVGDKYKLIPEIKTYFPANIARFIEPFVGGGSVFLNIEAKEYLLNDIDKNIYSLHKYLSGQSKKTSVFFESIYKIVRRYGLSRSYFEDVVPGNLKKRWKKTYYARFNKEGYERLRNYYNEGNKHYLLLYTLLIYGFNRMLRFNSRGDFNVPVGNVDFNNNAYYALLDYFSAIRDKKINWSNLDYREFLMSIKFRKNDFIYLDPPYLISNSEYNKLWDKERDKELMRILDALDKKRVKFAISNIIYHKGKLNKDFENWMRKYKVHKIKSNYISYHDNSNKQIKEVLVRNYD